MILTTISSTWKKIRKEVDWLLHKAKQGGGGDVSWGSIKGDLSDQTDLVNEMNRLAGGNFVYSVEPFEFDEPGYYTYDSEEDETLELPVNGNAVGKRYIIMNTVGEGNLTVTGNILESGAETSTHTIAPGENYIIYNNGTHWVIV